MDQLFKEYIAYDTLRDSRPAVIRAIRPDDKELLQEGMQHLSSQSQYFRFFTHKDKLSEKELAYFTEVDFIKHVALLAGFDIDGEFSPAATARYIVSTDPHSLSTAEIAVTVVEEFQGLGFATILLQHLIKIARANGVTEFKGMVLPDNKRMLNLLTRSGLPCKSTLEDTGEWEISLALA